MSKKSKEELGDMCALTLNEIINETMIGDRLGSVFLGHKHIHCIEITNSKGYLNKMGADYECPIKMTTVKGFKPEVDINSFHYLHKANKPSVLMDLVTYGRMHTGNHKPFADVEFTHRKMLRDWEFTHYDYFDFRKQREVKYWHESAIARDVNTEYWGVWEDSRDIKNAISMYPYRAFVDAERGYTSKRRSSFANKTEFPDRSEFNEVSEKYDWSTFVNNRRARMDLCFDPTAMDYAENIIDDTAYHIPHCHTDDTHIYKFYSTYTGQFIFSITLFDFSKNWFPTGEDPRTKTTRGFVAATLTNNIDKQGMQVLGDEEFCIGSIHPVGLGGVNKKHILFKENIPVADSTRTYCVFGSGINTPISVERKTQAYKNYCRGLRYDNFTERSSNVGWRCGGQNYQRHLVDHLMPLAHEVSLIVDEYLTDKSGYNELTWNNVEPMLSEDSIVKSTQMYVPPRNPNAHKATYLMYSIHSAMQVFKTLSEKNIDPPLPQELEDLRHAKISSKLDYAREVRDFVHGNRDTFDGNRVIDNDYQQIHTLKEYSINPDKISVRAVDIANQMKKDDRTYDHAMQAYAPEVVIKCCNVTGQVFTADSFDYAKHDQFWMRDCFFSRGAIQNLTKYFGKVLTDYFDTPPPTKILNRVRNSLDSASKCSSLLRIDLDNHTPENVATYIYLTETLNLYSTYNSIEQFAEVHKDWYGVMCMLDYAVPDEQDLTGETSVCIPNIGAKHITRQPYDEWNATDLVPMIAQDHFANTYYYIYKKGEMK